MSVLPYFIAASRNTGPAYVAPPPAAAPTVDNSLIQGFATSSGTHDFATAGLTVAGLAPIVFITSNGSTSTLVSFSGSVDDTSSPIGGTDDASPRLIARTVNVVGALDPTWTYVQAASSRPVICAVAIDGLESTAFSMNPGAGSDLPTHPGMVIEGGPKNVLVLAAAAIRGSHVTNPPTAPAGWTEVRRLASLSNNPTNTTSATLIVVRRTYAIADLSWTDGDATLPALTFGGLTDIGTQPWRVMLMACLPSGAVAPYVPVFTEAFTDAFRR